MDAHIFSRQILPRTFFFARLFRVRFFPAAAVQWLWMCVHLIWSSFILDFRMDGVSCAMQTREKKE